MSLAYRLFRNFIFANEIYTTGYDKLIVEIRDCRSIPSSYKSTLEVSLGGIPVRFSLVAR